MMVDRSEQKKKQVAINIILKEIENNINEVKFVYKYHNEVSENVSNYLDTVDAEYSTNTAIGIIGQFIPRGLLVAAIQNTAWSMAIETEATSLFDYDMAYDMTYLYDLQNRGFKSTTSKILDLLTEPMLFDPDKNIEVVQVFKFAMNEFSKQEEYLEESYMEFLKKYKR